mmetsp:Transcript_6476/g.20135  ORF Transcript_6476/g.20135 Transcript_6476/m.20135 type:complete len:523 (+) Transcript_6476:49-1617(+)
MRAVRTAALAKSGVPARANRNATGKPHSVLLAGESHLLHFVHLRRPAVGRHLRGSLRGLVHGLRLALGCLLVPLARSLLLVFLLLLLSLLLLPVVALAPALGLVGLLKLSLYACPLLGGAALQHGVPGLGQGRVRLEDQELLPVGHLGQCLTPSPQVLLCLLGCINEALKLPPHGLGFAVLLVPPHVEQDWGDELREGRRLTQQPQVVREQEAEVAADSLQGHGLRRGALGQVQQHLDVRGLCFVQVAPAALKGHVSALRAGLINGLHRHAEDLQDVRADGNKGLYGGAQTVHAIEAVEDEGKVRQFGELALHRTHGDHRQRVGQGPQGLHRADGPGPEVDRPDKGPGDEELHLGLRFGLLARHLRLGLGLGLGVLCLGLRLDGLVLGSLGLGLGFVVSTGSLFGSLVGLAELCLLGSIEVREATDGITASHLVLHVLHLLLGDALQLPPVVGAVTAHHVNQRAEAQLALLDLLLANSAFGPAGLGRLDPVGRLGGRSRGQPGHRIHLAHGHPSAANGMGLP